MDPNEEIILSSLCDRIMAFCNRLNKRLDAADLRVAEIQASRHPGHESSTYEQPWMPSYWEIRPPPLPDPDPPYNLVAPDQLDGQHHSYNQPPRLPYNESYGQSQPYTDTDPSWGNSFNYGLHPYQQPGNAGQPCQQPHNPHWCPSASPEQLQMSHTRRPTCWDPPQARQPYGWEPQARTLETIEGQRPQPPCNQDSEPFRQLQNSRPSAHPWQLDCTVFSPPSNHHSVAPLPAAVPQPPQPCQLYSGPPTSPHNSATAPLPSAAAVPPPVAISPLCSPDVSGAEEELLEDEPPQPDYTLMQPILDYLLAAPAVFETRLETMDRRLDNLQPLAQSELDPPYCLRDYGLTELGPLRTATANPLGPQPYSGYSVEMNGNSEISNIELFAKICEDQEVDQSGVKEKPVQGCIEVECSRQLNASRIKILQSQIDLGDSIVDNASLELLGDSSHVRDVASMNHRSTSLDADARLIPLQNNTPCLGIGCVDKLHMSVLNYQSHNLQATQRSSHQLMDDFSNLGSKRCTNLTEMKQGV